MFGNEDDALNTYQFTHNRLLAAGISEDKIDRFSARPCTSQSSTAHFNRSYSIDPIQ